MISLLLALVALPAFAGDKAGNGGNVVLCRDASGKVSSVKMLDHYEAETIWGFKLDLGAPSLDPLEKVKLALERARRFHPLTADQLEARANGFFDDANLLSNVELTPVDDSGEYFLPLGCQLKQIAVQRVKEFPNDKTFLVNKDVWDLLDNDGKAGLILHEIAYEKLLRTKPPTGPTPVSPESRMARYFNALVSSTSYERFTLDQYLPQLTQLWFLTDLAIDGVVIEQVSVSSRYGVRGTLPKNGPSTMEFYGSRLPLAPGSWVNWLNGRLLNASPVSSLNLTIRSTTFVTAPGRPIQLYPSGIPEGFFLDHAQEVEWNGVKMTLAANQEVQFYEDGSSPIEVHLDGYTRWLVNGSLLINGPKRGYASFDTNGAVKSIGCIARNTDLAVTDTRGRVLTCRVNAHPLCTYDHDGAPFDSWPQYLSFDANGKVTSVESYDPSKNYCDY